MKRAVTWRCSLCGWLNPKAARVCVGCDKRKPREKKARPVPVFRPWACVILALDTAEQTGWSIRSLGKLKGHGEFKIYSDAGVRRVVDVVERAKSAAAQLNVPWVCMSERSWGGHMGLGATHAWGYWTFALRNAQLPRARMGQVYPATWRARVLAKGMASAERDVVRLHEQQTACALVGHTCGPDESAAILIGKWATQAGETGELLPKNARVTV